jgi:hypothetical protein
MHRRFRNCAAKNLAADCEGLRPGRSPATFVLGDCLIDQTPVIFLECFQSRIPENAQTSLLVGKKVLAAV